MTEIETYPVPDFFGHTVFCDDIRFEMDGKLTFVGVYANGVMPTPADFPLTLPKFCFSLIFNQRKDLFVPSLGTPDIFAGRSRREFVHSSGGEWASGTAVGR